MDTILLLFESFSLGSEMMLLLLPFMLLYYYQSALFGYKNIFLVLSGVAFLWVMSNFSWLSVFIIVILSVINFYLVRGYQQSFQRLFLLIGFVINLSTLILLKYIPAFTEGLNGFTHFVGIVGISFYIFHVWSVFMDVHSKKILTPIRILDFFVYLLYFPKLITGPLVRYNDFEKELTKSSVSELYVMQGIGLLLIGLVKKAVSDFIALYPTTIYANPEGYNGFEHLFAMYGYALYIFLDFSAYTDMARGISRLFGLELPDNFNSPYRSKSISEFWRRWHITLSNWIRDYIYIPLGGSKKGTLRTYLNLFIAFFISGLWHGVGINFALWGVWHGTGMVVNKLFNNRYKLHYIFAWFITFHWISIGWIFFANPIDVGMLSLHKIFLNFDAKGIYSILWNNLLWYSVLIVAFIYSFWDNTIIKWWSETFEKSHFTIKLFLFWIVIWFTLMTHQGRVNSFIYQTF